MRLYQQETTKHFYKNNYGDAYGGENGGKNESGH
jgi:hypothetical protein